MLSTDTKGLKLKRMLNFIGVGPGSLEHLSHEALNYLKESSHIFYLKRKDHEDLYLIQELHTLKLNLNFIPCDSYKELKNSLLTQLEEGDCSCIFSGSLTCHSLAQSLYRAIDQEKDGRLKTISLKFNFIEGRSSLDLFKFELMKHSYLSLGDKIKIASLHGKAETSSYASCLISELRAAYKESATWCFFLLDALCLEYICFSLLPYLAQKKDSNLSCALGFDLSYPSQELIFGSAQELSVQVKDINLQGRLAIFALKITEDLIDEYKLKKLDGSGLSDADFLRSASVPMSKEEVRALVLRKLALNSQSFLWDIGAGSGSISIEAAFMNPGLRVFAFEKSTQALELLKDQIEHFSLSSQVKIIAGEVPAVLHEAQVQECLGALQKPSHIFIGGCSGSLPQLFESLYDLIQPGESINVVATAVCLSTAAQLEAEFSKDCYEDFDCSLISSVPYKKRGSFRLPQAHNPVYIFSAKLVSKRKVEN